MKPSVGRMVHYVAPGSADGTFRPEHRAAVIVEVFPNDEGEVDARYEGVYVGLCILNPSGIHFVTAPQDEQEKGPYTWHWPEREPEA